MRPNLQFAFLGCHNSYLASVTWVPQSDRSHESLKIHHHGIPKHWVDKYLELAKNRYTSNIRGNDWFAFLGHHMKGTAKTYTEKSRNMLVEIEALRTLADRTKTKTSEPLLLSLGPAPGSFFAESSGLKRYRWANLPSDLEDAIQEEVCRNGHGTIHDVAINAAGGWVIQFHEGKTYNWGGVLPKQLKDALLGGLKHKIQLKNLCLNHQNKDDYVLVFMDGTAYVSLHWDFHEQIKSLIMSAFASNLPLLLSKPVKVKFHFTASCTCTSQNQDQVNAAYYNQRGRFHLRRSSPVHALAYMREAYRLEITNMKYRDDYFMARVAAGKLEQTAEDFLQKDGAFHNEYEFQKDRSRRIEELLERQQEMLREAQRQNLPREWSYIDARPQPIGIVKPNELHGEESPFELEDPESIAISNSRESAE